MFYWPHAFTDFNQRIRDFRLRRRRWRFHLQCYLHCLRTLSAIIIRQKIIMSSSLYTAILAAPVRTWIHTHQRLLLRLPRCKVFQLLCPNFEWWPIYHRQLSHRRLRFRSRLQLWDSVWSSRLQCTACMSPCQLPDQWIADQDGHRLESCPNPQLQQCKPSVIKYAYDTRKTNTSRPITECDFIIRMLSKDFYWHYARYVATLRIFVLTGVIFTCIILYLPLL